MDPNDRPAARPPSPPVTRRLPPTAASAARARALVRETLDGRIASGAVHTVELLTCEVVTNAIVHARSPCRVRLTQPRAGVVRVEVYDEAGDRPYGTPAAWDGAAHAGRGLALVDALASCWDTANQPAGKTIWFEVDTNSAASAQA